MEKIVMAVKGLPGTPRARWICCVSQLHQSGRSGERPADAEHRNYAAEMILTLAPETNGQVAVKPGLP